MFSIWIPRKAEWIECSTIVSKRREVERALIFYARFAAFRPSKPKSGFHPNTRNPRVLGAQGLLGAAARKPAAQGRDFLKCIFRHDYAALAPGGRAGLNAKAVP